MKQGFIYLILLISLSSNNVNLKTPIITTQNKPIKTAALMKKAGLFGKVVKEAETVVGVASDVSKAMDKVGFFGGGKKPSSTTVGKTPDHYSHSLIQDKYEAKYGAWRLQSQKQVIANAPDRWPDYVSLGINIGPVVSWSGQIALDRYGRIYVAPGWGGVGKSPSFISGSVTEGWLNQKNMPSPKILKTFLSGSSATLSGGWIVGGAQTWSGGVSSREIGLFAAPQIGVSYHSSKEVRDIGNILHW